MFRTGGTPNEGIMHGLVNRKNYNIGTRTEEITAAMDKYARIPKSRFPMGQIGLNLVSGEYAGDGLLSNIAGSAKGPYSQWTAADDARAQALPKRRASAVGVAVSEGHAEKMARLKAAGQSGFLKKETTEGAYEHFLEANLKSAAELQGYQKPNLNQKYPRKMAEFDSYISRNLRATNDPQGKAIAKNFVDFVPFNQKTQEFDYSTMMPGMYYYDPRYRIFVQRVPDDPNTPEDESGYFQYDNTTFSKTKLSGTK